MELLGQKEDQEATVEVQAMRPNKIVLHSKSAAASGTLTSDGTTVTLLVDGGTTYKQMPAPANFAEFSKLPGLASIGLDGTCDVFPFLAMESDSKNEVEEVKGTKVLDSTDLDGKHYERVEASMDGNRVVFWLDRAARFPLSRIEIDPSKLLDEQLAQLGPQASMVKGMLKLDVAMLFSNGDITESMPDETFRFTPPESATKE